jgi:hypothetical protein
VLNGAVARIDGWSVSMDADAPRILDEELGKRLGFARPRDIRKLIDRLVKDEKLRDIRMRATASRIELRRGVHRDQVVNEYWLTERQALKVIAKSETAIADAILDEVIDVFIAVRNQMSALQQVQVPVLPNSPTLGDPVYRRHVQDLCRSAAHGTGASIHRVHGWLKILYNASGIYRISGAHYEEVCRHLRAWAFGRVLPPSTTPLLKAVPDPAQRILPFPDVRRPANLEPV